MSRRVMIAVLIGGIAAAVCPGADGREAAMMSGTDFRQIVRSAKEKVFPAVVYVKCLIERHESGKKITSEATGSGVLIGGKGEMLTNWHVVDKAVEVRCLLYDGRSAHAEVVGRDKDTDLALLQLKLPTGAKPVPFAAIGDSTVLLEGDFVMAMGAPWGLNRSVSIGIISCTRRYLHKRSEYSLWLQTDAAINPGNSGGPLVNTGGEIIGINTLGISAGSGMGFSIPAKTVKFIVGQLREHGKVNWSWTGLHLQPLKDFDKNIYFEADEGVLVASTDPDSPAREGGIQPRDLILKVNGQAVSGIHDEDLPHIRRLLGLLPKDKPAAVLLRRAGKQMTLKLTPRRKGKVEGDELECPRWDMTVKTINKFENEDLYFYRKKGVFIFGVKYPGNAATGGLREQDIILRIGAKQIVTLADVKAARKQAVDNIKTKHKVIFTVLRQGLTRQIVLDFSRDYEKE